MYVELHASSAFSFLDGASLPEALVDRAAELGYPALALLDRDGVFGIPRFHLAAKRAGLKAIVGAELTISLCSRGPTPARAPSATSRLGRAADAADSRSGLDSPAAQHGHARRTTDRGLRTTLPAPRLISLPVLVASREGYRNLCRLITQMKLRAPKGEGALALEDLDGRVGGLVVLAGRTAIDAPRFGVGGLVDRLVGIFGAANTCIELQRHLRRDEESDNHALLDLAAAYHLTVIASNGVRFAEPVDRPLYDVLTCIRHKTTLANAGRRLSVNAERYLKAADAMARLFSDVPQAIPARASWPTASNTRWPISATAFRITRCRRARRWRRSCGKSRRRERASGIARIATARAGRSSASWISSRNSISPVTS